MKICKSRRSVGRFEFQARKYALVLIDSPPRLESISDTSSDRQTNARTGLAIFLPSSVRSSRLIFSRTSCDRQIGAYCYAELGCMIRKSGADYAYIMETFGPFLAFVRLWVECMIVRPCSQAIVALTFSVYVLKPLFPDCVPPDDSVKMLAACCICK